MTLSLAAEDVKFGPNALNQFIPLQARDESVPMELGHF